MKTVTIVDGVEMTRELWAKKITDSWQSSIDSILETGRNLIQAKEGLAHGEWIAMVESDLPFSWATAKRLISIAENPVLSNSAHGRYLPTSWRTLSELTKLDPKTLEAKIEAGEVNPATQRKDVTAMIAKIKPESVVTRQRRIDRIEKERPDLAAQMRAGTLTYSGADSIIKADKLQNKRRPEFQGKPSENAENAAVELAEMLRANCDQNEIPLATVITYLEECNNEQVAAVLKYGDVTAAAKRDVKAVLRHVAKEFGYPKFEGAALAILKECSVPFHKVGELAEAQKAAKEAKGRELTRDERKELAQKVKNTPSKAKRTAVL